MGIFIEKRKIWFSISIAIILLGFILTIIHGGINYGVDFTGGTLMQIDFHEPVSTSVNGDINSVLNSLGLLKESYLQQVGNNKDIMQIKTKSLSVNERDQLFQKLKEKFNLPDNAPLSVTSVGPIMGQTLKSQAIWSIIVASILILIYITFRFEFKFGVAAVVALLHDLLILYAAYAIFNIPLSVSFVAASLTVLGYSVNDTIVIFDRIRDNLKVMRKDSYDVIADTSITETLARSINTLLTVIITLTALYLLGGASMREFVLPLLIGIISGGYSSIFIASPLWYMMKVQETKGRDNKGKDTKGNYKNKVKTSKA